MIKTWDNSKYELSFGHQKLLVSISRDCHKRRSMIRPSSRLHFTPWSRCSLVVTP
jgi:hypothetical protein